MRKIYFTLLLAALLTAAAPLVQAALDGERLYQQHCAVCHRSGGEGGLGLPIKNEKLRVLPDSYLFKTIRNGRPGRVMPAFEVLSDAQVNAIVRYLRGRSGMAAPREHVMQLDGDPSHGKSLFAQHCAKCHGPGGRGLGKGTGKSYSRAREFDVVPPAISNRGFLASASDSLLFDVISNGRAGTIMPAFSKQGLGLQAISDVITYLRSLQNDATATGADSPEPVPAPTLIIDSPHDFKTTLANLKQALAGYNFRIFPDRYIEQGLFPEWEVNQKQVTVRYCNFNQLYEILKIDPRVGIGLPCRITVVEQANGQVQLVAMNMALIARLFNNDQLQGIAQEMDNIQRDILDEVTF